MHTKVKDQFVDNEYITITDESISVGKQKLLLQLAAPADSTGKPLSHSDVSIVGMSVSPSWTGDSVKAEMEKTSKSIGRRPLYSVSDNGYNLCNACRDAGKYGIFEYSKHEFENNVTHMNKVVHVSKVLIGLYNRDGALLEKLDGESYFDDDSPKSLLVVGRTFTQTRQIKRMLKVVQSGEGYLRIVCKRKDMADFDLTTTPYQK